MPQVTAEQKHADDSERHPGDEAREAECERLRGKRRPAACEATGA